LQPLVAKLRDVPNAVRGALELARAMLVEIDLGEAPASARTTASTRSSAARRTPPSTCTTP